MRHALLALLLVGLAARGAISPASASAQTATGDAAELETEARARFQLGQLYYSQARFAEAAREFEAAYATHPHPLLLHNLYLARRDEGNVPAAVDALTRYLATATDLSAADRRLLEGRLATMQRQRPATTPETPDTPPVDPVVGDPEPGGGDDAIVAPTDEASDEVASDTTDTSGGIGLVPGAVTLGIGGAALIGAAIAGGIALSVQSDRDAQCNLAGGACPASLDQNDYASRFGAARDAGWGLFIVGAATATLGGVLLGIGASQGASEAAPVTTSAACDGTGCFVSVSGRM